MKKYMPRKRGWKSKRCPKCGSPVDMMETCVKCGRSWSEELDKDFQGNIIEAAIGLDEGEQYEPYVTPPKKKKLKPESPSEFHWMIKDNDSEAEIVRKRSLMKLDTRRLYNQMGMSVRAQESSKSALLWLTQLISILSEKEKEELAPVLTQLNMVFNKLSSVRQSKIFQAVRAEQAIEKAYQKARQIRVKHEIAASKKRKKSSKFPEAGQNSEGMGLTPVNLDKDSLIEQITNKMIQKEKT